MPTEVLTIGPSHDLTQNTVYALPARRVLMFSVTTTGWAQNTTATTSGALPLTLTNGQAEVAGGFIMNTTGNATLYLKTSS